MSFHSGSNSEATRERLLSTPLTEMSLCINDDINCLNMLVKHQLFQEEGKSMDSNKLIEILGGSDAILHHYLSSNNQSLLTQQQLNDINELLCNDQDTNNDNDDNTPTLNVSFQDTLLHQYTGNKIANKLMSMLFSKPTVIVTGFFLIITIVISVLYWSVHLSIIPFSLVRGWSCTIMSLGIIYASLSFLLLNKTITRNILSTFMAWFKLFYIIRYCVCSSIYYWQDMPVLNSIFCVSVFIAYLFYALIDGLWMPLNAKIAIGIITALVFAWMSTYWTFFVSSKVIRINLQNDYGFEFDVATLAASSMRVIAIFMVKQAIYSIWKPTKATMIKKSVQIVWKQ